MFGIKKNNSPFFQYRIKFLSMNKFFSIVKNIQGGGGGVVVNPLLGFPEFIFFSQGDKTSAPDALSNCSFISRAF